MQKRQIVFIMTDSQRQDMVSCYSNHEMSTPNIDALAAQGVRYNKAYTTQPVCGPARSALFTGMYPHSNGSWANSYPIGDNVKTIGQRLTDAGIHTAYVGKWHVDGGDYFGLGRCPDGWDGEYWYDMRNYLEDMSDEDRRWSRNPSLDKTREVTADFTFGHKCSDRAIKFLEQSCDEDFFMVVSYDEPHMPALSPKPYSTMFADYLFPKSANVYDNLANKPEHQRVWAGKELYRDNDALQIRAPIFLGCNSFIDDEIGRVLKKVAQVAPDALVVYTSDHGDFLSSHGLCAKGPAPYDEINKIPLIIKGGDVGKIYDHPVSHINLMPTVLEYMGLPVPRIMEGKSILKTITDQATKVNDCIFLEFGRYEVDHDGFGGFQPLRCVFDGRYKLCINLLTTDEFYDLDVDPYELNNLIDEPNLTKIRNSLHDKILDFMNNTRDPFRGYYWERRPWRTDAREATWGYTGYTRQRENEEYEPRQLDYATGLPMEEAVRKK